MVSRYHGNLNICVVTFWMEQDNIFRFKSERDNAISFVTVKMGLAIPISHRNLRITNYHGKCRGDFNETIPGKYKATTWYLKKN